MGGGSGDFFGESAFLNPISTVVDDPFNGVVDDTLGTNIYGANSKDKALAAQERAAGLANQQLAATYKEQQGIIEPYKTAGDAGLAALSNNTLMDNWQQDPAYQFQLAEGNKAINAAASARGMGNSGAAMKELTAYGQNLASQEYDKIYNRAYNRNSQLAGYGQDATNTLVNASASYGNSVSNNITGVGNAQANSLIAQGNQRAAIGQQAISIGSQAAFCDERLKTEIVPISKENIEELKSVISANKFKYIDEKYGEGEWMGVMAQDLMKSKLGKWIVSSDEEGHLRVDMNKVGSVMLAYLAVA